MFQVRGRAGVDGPNLVAEGPFVLWGSPDPARIRADFYGPDGLPVLSLRCDSSGSVVYLPEEGRATWYRGGFPLGNALIGISDLVGLVRTGFPLDLPQWVLSLGGATDPPEVRWTLVSTPGPADTITVRLEPGEPFPSLQWKGGGAEVTSASPGDIYGAWPTSWRLYGPDRALEMDVRSISEPDPPPAAVWRMDVPVPVDTTSLDAEWEPAWDIPGR